MDLNHIRKPENLSKPHHWTRTWLVAPLTVLIALAGWELTTRLGHLPPFILPPPELVWQSFQKLLLNGSLAKYTASTLSQILMGLFIGSLAATFLGYCIAKSRLFERLISPFLVASQAVPIVAIAPLLFIWFGTGIFTKVLICSLIVFFPVLINTVVGIRAVPTALHELMRSLRATRWQILHHLEIPAALPVFLGGLRIGATLSVIGAVVGEFVSLDSGLGFMIAEGRGRYDTAQVFVAIFTLVSLALGLYGIVILLEKKFLAWQDTSHYS